MQCTTHYCKRKLFIVTAIPISCALLSIASNVSYATGFFINRLIIHHLHRLLPNFILLHTLQSRLFCDSNHAHCLHTSSSVSHDHITRNSKHLITAPNTSRCTAHPHTMLSYRTSPTNTSSSTSFRDRARRRPIVNLLTLHFSTDLLHP